MTKKRTENTAIPPELTDKARGIRLQKAMASAGIASRRDCEKLIESGMVRVNGQPVTALPAWVDPAADRIEVEGREIARPRKTKNAQTARAGTTTLMLHKPKRVISTTDDEQGRTSVIDLVNYPGGKRLFPIGRLDADSTGLILLTDDGELANRLTHPRYEVSKQYQVVVRGKVTQDDLQKLRKGLMLTGPRPRTNPRSNPRPRHDPRSGPRTDPRNKTDDAKRAAVDSVAIVKYEKDRARGDRTHLRITLSEGQNREIRRLLARLGFKVRKLKREAIGPLRLKGLAIGEWRKLTASELSSLRKAAGLTDKKVRKAEENTGNRRP